MFVVLPHPMLTRSGACPILEAARKQWALPDTLGEKPMSNFVFPKTVLFLCATAMLGLAAAHPANAQTVDSLTAGNTAYLKGDYKLARKYFEHATKTRPSWLAFYHLANTDAKLGDLNRAEQEYKRSMMLSADAKVIKTCQAAIQNIAHVRKYGAPPPVVADLSAVTAARPSGTAPTVPDTAGGIPANAAAIAAGNDIVAKKALLKKLQAEDAKNQLTLKLVVQASSDFNKRRSEAIARREAILKEGREDAERARKAGRDEINDNSNYLVRNTATGALSIDIPTVVEEDIEARWEAEAQRRLRSSELRAQGVHIPEYDNTAHHMLNGLKDDGRGGTRMSTHGTNLHIRNYVHEPKRTTAVAAHSAAPAASATGAKSNQETNKQVAGKPEASNPAKLR